MQIKINDIKRIFCSTLDRTDSRLKRLKQKFDIAKQGSFQEPLEKLYQSNWQEIVAKQDDLYRPLLLFIAPLKMQFDNGRFGKLGKKSKKVLQWSLHLTSLVTGFDPAGDHINRKQDALRALAAMQGKILSEQNSPTKGIFGQVLDHLSEHDVEAVILVACSAIRELAIPVHQKRIACLFLEDLYLHNKPFPGQFLLKSGMDSLKAIFSEQEQIYQNGFALLKNLGNTRDINSSQWKDYACSIIRQCNKDHQRQEGLALLSLLSIIACLQLDHLYLPNTQNLKEYVMKELPKYHIKELSSYLEARVKMLQSDPWMRAMFTGAKITTMSWYTCGATHNHCSLC